MTERDSKKDLGMLSFALMPKTLGSMLTTFTTIAHAFTENEDERVDEFLESISTRGRSGDDAPEGLVECVDFLLMLRQTKRM